MAANLYVVDASVVGAWFIQDQFSDRAEQFRNAIVSGSIQVRCPDFLLLELINLLLWKHISGGDIVAAIKSIVGATIDFIPLTVIDSGLIIELATTHHLTSYDALYLSLADQIGATLLSADGDLLKAAGVRGMHIRDFKES